MNNNYSTNYMNTIHLIGHSHPVDISTIVWLEGEANYTRVHYQNGTSSIVTQPLQWFENRLSFLRIHRSAIVNPMYVQEFEYINGRSGWVRLIDDRVIPVSRNRLKYASIMLGNRQNPPGIS